MFQIFRILTKRGYIKFAKFNEIPKGNEQKKYELTVKNNIEKVKIIK